MLWISSFFLFLTARLHSFTLKHTYMHTNSAKIDTFIRQACASGYLPRGSYLPVVAFLAQLFLEVSQSEAVGFHHAAIGDLLATEEIGDHQFLRPDDAKRKAALTRLHLRWGGLLTKHGHTITEVYKGTINLREMRLLVIWMEINRKCMKQLKATEWWRMCVERWLRG